MVVLHDIIDRVCVRVRVERVLLKGVDDERCCLNPSVATVGHSRSMGNIGGLVHVA